MTATEATEWLRSGGYLVHDTATPITHDQWERRAVRDPDQIAAIEQSLAIIRRTLNDCVVELEAIITLAAEGATSYPPASGTRREFAAAAERLLRTRASWIERSFRDHIKRIQDLACLEDLILLHLTDRNSDRWVQRTQRQIRSIRAHVPALNRQLNRQIDTLRAFTPDDPPAEFDNLEAITLNLSDRRLVPVTYAGGRATVDSRLDPRFAMQVISFIIDVKARGYSHIYSNGFWRHPKSPIDRGHTRGQSWDVAGFRYRGERYGLRSGRSTEHALYGRNPELTDPPAPDPDAGRAEYSRQVRAWMRGASNWYMEPGENATVLRDRTRAFEMFKQMIRVHFGNFNYIGPGYNREHDTHFHIQFLPMRNRQHRHEQNVRRLDEGRPTLPNDTLLSAPATRLDPSPRDR